MDCKYCESTHYCVCDMLIELGHCRHCLYYDCICDENYNCRQCREFEENCVCYTYNWEDYDMFNNCRQEDCKECICNLLIKNGYCVECFQKDCIHRKNTESCNKCDSPYECVCDILIAHGHCSECLYYGDDCQCELK